MTGLTEAILAAWAFYLSHQEQIDRDLADLGPILRAIVTKAEIPIGDIEPNPFDPDGQMDSLINNYLASTGTEAALDVLEERDEADEDRAPTTVRNTEAKG